MEKYLYVAFHVTADAIATEAIMAENNLEGKLVPVPRSLSAGCGTAWRGHPSDEEETKKLLEVNDIEWEQIKVL